MPLRPSNKTVVTERIDPKTGHIIRRTVITPMRGTRSRTPSVRQQLIDRITQLVQNLEVDYYFGNNVIECLKNYKRNPRVKHHKPRYFIPDKDKLVIKFEAKYHNPPMPNEVLAKEIGVLEEVLQNIDSYELEEHWKTKLKERHEILTKLKKARDRHDAVQSVDC